MTRVLVCGGRDYTAEWNVFNALRQLYATAGGVLTIIEGGARGADQAAADFAEAWAYKGVEHIQFKAKWREHGKAAGPLRNQRMLDEGKPDMVLAFPGGVGTADMIRRAKAAGLDVWTYDPDNDRLNELEEKI